MKRALVAILLAALMGLSSALSIDPATVVSQQPGPVFLALGDSYTAGLGGSDPSRRGYAALTYDFLRLTTPNLEFINLATPFETTAAFSSGSNSQRERAIAVLKSRRVAAVLVTLGGNDLYALTAPGRECDLSTARRPADLTQVAATSRCKAGVDAALTATKPALAEALKAINGAKQEETILVVGLYYNPFDIGLEPEFVAATNDNTRRLNAIITESTAELGTPKAKVVDFRLAFDGKVAALTNGRQRDVHPNDLGHRVMAAAAAQSVAGSDDGYFSGAPAGTPRCPEAGRWQITYWRGAQAPLSAVSIVCPLVDRYWVFRQGKWFAFAPLLPGASDTVTLAPGEAIFALGSR